MAFDQEAILQQYIARLMDLQDARDDWLGEDDLEQTARDLGLSTRDLERARATVERHRERARRFSQHDAWDDAVAEYRQALVLAPLDAGLAYELAVAHASRYEATADAADHAAAERYARRAIDLDPELAPAYELLGVLKKSSGAPQTVSRQRLLVAVATLLLLAAGGVMFFVLERAAVPVPAPPAPVAPVPPAPSAPALPAPTATSAQRELPVTFEVDGFEFDVQRSRFNDYDSSFAYTLHATLRPTAGELHHLRLRLDLLDADGAILHTHFFDGYGDHEPPLRPGETAPLAPLIFQREPPPDARQARLTLEAAERPPAAANYGDEPDVPLRWPAGQPAYLDLAATERTSTLRTNTLLGGERTHTLTLALHNRGDRSVEGLRLKVTWYDAAGGVAAEDERFVVPSGPAMRPGQTWLVRFYGKFPPGDAAPYTRYAVSVLDVE